ncbi:MAG: Crp/Fnr family transcriptional regulator, partial [Thiobacillaceae bacterium]|nr:Crp/Fnr family transcriptional regulator [Thiobacillaceae bacterium]
MIRLFRVSPQGEEKVIDLIGPGRSFAEAVLFMGGNYPVCAAALAASRLIAIDGAHFRAWLAQDTWRCFRLMAAMSARMHKLVSDIEQLTLMKGTDRLLQYLLDHANPDEEGRQVVELGAPKQVIASRLGIKPETFSRLLHKLADQGLIEVHEHRIHLLDPERMRLGRGEAGDSPDSSSARFVGAAKAATSGRSPLGGVGNCAVATFVAPTRPLGRLAWGSGVDDQRRGHPPALRRQDVVGAAGGLG